MEYFNNINWANPSWDLFIILIFVLFFLLYGLSLGKNRIVIIMISMYMALAIVNTAPYIKELNGFKAVIKINDFSVVQITLFLGVFIVLFFLISRGALVKIFGNADAFGSLWQVMLFSFLQVGLMISIVMSYLPEHFLENISWQMRSVFVSDPARLSWLVAPVVLMAITKKKPKDEE